MVKFEKWLKSNRWKLNVNKTNVMIKGIKKGIKKQFKDKIREQSFRNC